MIVKVDEEDQDKPKEELLKMFTEEVEKFSLYMGTLPAGGGGGVLSSAEKALVKSYLVFKFREKG